MAPSVNSPLLPIVIPEIVVPPHFTTLGNGLLQNGHARESPSTLASLLLPSPAAPRGVANSAKPKTWWRAQCLHYGLDMPVSTTVERMRTKIEEELRSGPAGKMGQWGLTVPAELIDLEYKKNGEFRKLNAQVRELTTAKEEKPKAAKEEKPKAAKEEKPKAAKAAKGKGKAVEAAPEPAAKKKAASAKAQAEPKKVEVKKVESKKVEGKKTEAAVKKPRAKKADGAAGAEETITTITTTVTTTSKKSASATAAASKSGSGAGALSSAAKKGPKAAAAAKDPLTAAKSAGVTKPKPKKETKKEVKQEWGNRFNFEDMQKRPKDLGPGLTQQEILRQQAEFKNSFNSTSTQGPLPTYLRKEQPPQQWQTPPKPSASNTPMPSNTPMLERWLGSGGNVRQAREDRAVSRSASPPSQRAPMPRPRQTARRGRPFNPGASGSGRNMGNYEPRNPSPQGFACCSGRPQGFFQAGHNHEEQRAYQPPPMDPEAGIDEPPPAYGSWDQNNNNNNNAESDYSDGDDGPGVSYEDFDAVGLTQDQPAPPSTRAPPATQYSSSKKQQSSYGYTAPNPQQSQYKYKPSKPPQLQPQPQPQIHHPAKPISIHSSPAYSDYSDSSEIDETAEVSDSEEDDDGKGNGNGNPDDYAPDQLQFLDETHAAATYSSDSSDSASSSDEDEEHDDEDDVYDYCRGRQQEEEEEEEGTPVVSPESSDSEDYEDGYAYEECAEVESLASYESEEHEERYVTSARGSDVDMRDAGGHGHGGWYEYDSVSWYEDDSVPAL